MAERIAGKQARLTEWCFRCCAVSFTSFCTPVLSHAAGSESVFSVALDSLNDIRGLIWAQRLVVQLAAHCRLVILQDDEKQRSVGALAVQSLSQRDTISIK